MAFKLDPEKKEKWVKALRSGRYRQGKGNLKKRIKKGKIQYCCLGVYAQIEGIPLYEPKGLKGQEEIRFHTETGSCSFLPLDVMPESVQRDLAKMNDTYSAPFSFKKIADWIEENL